MLNKTEKTYPLHQSPLYQLSSKRKLAVLLNVSAVKLKRLTNSDNLYLVKENEKRRQIDCPSPQLKKVQSQIADFLSRIEKPDFLFSPAKGRSYVSNASAHKNSAVIWRLDIKAYFPSTPSRRIYWFFHKQMQCSSDVAGILTALSTYKERLPTGSPLSPLLSYYAYVDMWAAIGAIAHESNCTLTVYMDDLTVSGVSVSKRLQWEIKKQIRRYGLHYHKERYYTGKSREVTGVIICAGKLKLPNRQHLKIYTLKQQLQKESDFEQGAKLRQQLQGYKSQERQIVESNKESK